MIHSMPTRFVQPRGRPAPRSRPGRHCDRNQRGQALTEFAIVGGLLLVSLFLSLSLLTKFFEARYKTLQAARYTAWERTVWLETPPYLAQHVATKNSQTLEEELDQRLFSHPDTPLVTLRSASSRPASPAPDPMLVVHPPHPAASRPLLDRGSRPRAATLGFQPGALQSFASMATRALAWPMRVMGFTPNHNGLVHAQVEAHLLPIDWHPSFDPRTSDHTAYASGARLALLTDGWTASDPAHTARIIRSLLPASQLDAAIDASDKTRAAARGVGGALPWLRPLESLELGIIRTEVVPAQRQTGLR